MQLSPRHDHWNHVAEITLCKYTKQLQRSLTGKESFEHKTVSTRRPLAVKALVSIAMTGETRWDVGIRRVGTKLEVF